MSRVAESIREGRERAPVPTTRVFSMTCLGRREMREDLRDVRVMGMLRLDLSWIRHT